MLCRNAVQRIQQKKKTSQLNLLLMLLFFASGTFFFFSKDKKTWYDHLGNPAYRSKKVCLIDVPEHVNILFQIEKWLPLYRYYINNNNNNVGSGTTEEIWCLTTQYFSKKKINTKRSDTWSLLFFIHGCVSQLECTASISKAF